MENETIPQNWPERTIQIATGEEIRLIADDPDEVTRIVAINSQNQEIGEIRFLCVEYNDQGERLLVITDLWLNKLGPDYTRKGIGEAILRMTNEHTDLPIVARCPLSGIQREDGSQLIDIGPSFVAKMRDISLIEKLCYDPWCSCRPDTPIEREEEYPEYNGLTE